MVKKEIIKIVGVIIVTIIPILVFRFVLKMGMIYSI